jgi:hypothetical protein
MDVSGHPQASTALPPRKNPVTIWRLGGLQNRSEQFGEISLLLTGFTIMVRNEVIHVKCTTHNDAVPFDKFADICHQNVI